MNWKNRVSPFLFFLAILYIVKPSYAADYGRQTVRIGYPIQKGLTEIDDQGVYSGYTYEYLMEIAQYTGWNYEFVQVPGDLNESLITLLDMLEEGEIDLIGGMLYSEEMEVKYDYTGYNYGTAYTVLNVFQDDAKRYTIDSMNKKALRVAVLEQSYTRIKELEEYCRMNQIILDMVVCKDQEEQMSALREGRADAMLDVSFSDLEGMRAIARFEPRPFYFVTTKGRPELVEGINSAITNIENSNPYFTTSLFEKYFAADMKNFWLSADEKSYIDQTRALKAGILMNTPPFLFKDESSGVLRGILVDYLQYITENTGLQFELIPAYSDREMDELLDNQKIDMVVGMTYDYNLSNRRQVAMSRPFLSGQYIMFLNDHYIESELPKKRLALPEGESYDWELKEKAARYETIGECLKAIETGRADYTYLDGYSAQFYKNLPQYKNMYLIPQTSKLHQICFGIAPPIRKELLNILNKIIATMEEEQLQTIINQNTSYHQKLTMMSLIAENPLPVFTVISGVMLLIIGILMWGIRVRIKMNRKISMDLKKYLQVYELASEYFFEYNYKTGTFMISLHMEQEDGSGNHLLNFDFTKWDDLEDEVDREQKQKFLKLITSKKDGAAEGNFMGTDGEYHWIRLIMKTMYDEDNQPAYVVGKITDIDSEKSERDALLEQAQRDSLTQLLNLKTSRRKITEELELLQAGMYGALILLDIDYFKSVNDTFGHMKGDDIIRQVAGMLSDFYSAQGIVGRPGGDEFIVYIRSLMDEGQLADTCLELCKNMSSILIGEGRYVTVSVGATLTKAGQKYDSLYLSADQALYQAKANGRNCFVIQKL